MAVDHEQRNSLIHTAHWLSWSASTQYNNYYTSADKIEGHLTLRVEFAEARPVLIEVRGESGVTAIAGHVCSIPSPLLDRVFNGIQCTSHEDVPTGCTIIQSTEASISFLYLCTWSLINPRGLRNRVVYI